MTRLDESARRIVGGGAVLILAKVVFVIAGYGLYFGLTRLLPQADFGVYLVVNSLVAVLNAIFITGTIQAVSRFLNAGSPDDASSVVATALRLQALLAGSATLLYVAAAPVISGWLGDPSLVPYLRISAVIPAAYAFYAIFMGYLNGRRRFTAQACFDMAFSTLKLTLVLGLTAWGLGVLGAISGFAGAAVIILGVAAWYVGPMGSGTGQRIAVATLLRFEIAVMAYQGLLNLAMQADLLLLKALMPVATGNLAVAEFGAAVKLAQVPQSLLVALNFLIFPLIAKSTSEQNREMTAEYVRTVLRVCLVLVVGPAVLLAVGGGSVMSLVFGPAYAQGGQVLAVLCLAYTMLSLLGVLLAMINGSGRPAWSLGVMGLTVALQAVACLVLIPRAGPVGAAVGTSLGYAAGLGLAGLLVHRQLGALLAPSSAGRVVVAAAAVVLAALAFPASGLRVVPQILLLALLYLGVLAASGELRSHVWALKAASGAR